jgi:caffeoyl-CoA O-methyltransferase
MSGKWSIINEEVEQYAEQYSMQPSELSREVAARTEAEMTGAQMLSGQIVCQFLQMLVLITGAKTVLDVGTFSGYSALNMAEALPKDGKLITLEKTPLSFEIANEYFKRSEHGHKIDSRLGRAVEIINSLDVTIDLAFVDAQKLETMDYYESILPKLKPGGLIIIDDVLWPVVKLHDQKRIDAMQEINEFVLQDSRVKNVILPIRHGLNIIQKLEI